MTGVAACILLLLGTLAAPAAAHLQVAQGRLLDLVRRSERLVVVKVRGPGTVAGSERVLAVTVLAPDGTTARHERLAVPARMALRPGRAHAFFVERIDGGWRAVHPPGAVFPAPQRGREYVAVDRALRPLPDDAVAAITDVLVATVAAQSRELRLHATMALLDTVHADHPLGPRQRAALRAALAAPGFDPELQPLLAPLAAEPAP